MMSHKSHVPGLHLCDDDRSSVDQNDVGFKATGVPVSLDRDQASLGEVAASSALPPRPYLELCGYTATGVGKALSEFSEGFEMPATPANVFRCTRHGPSSRIAFLWLGVG